MNIFVGNLPYELTDQELENAFTSHGEVTSARVIMDRFSGRSRGFGFVDMANNGEAEAAIQALNGSELSGRTLTVNEARPREGEPREGGAGGAGGGGGMPPLVE